MRWAIHLLTRTWRLSPGRPRPNTLRAVAHDLKTFFVVVEKPPAAVLPSGTPLRCRTLSDHHGAAGNVEHSSRDPVGFVGGEEPGSMCYVLRPPQAL
jgi:hypothetical protein